MLLMSGPVRAILYPAETRAEQKLVNTAYGKLALSLAENVDPPPRSSTTQEQSHTTYTAVFGVDRVLSNVTQEIPKFQT